MPLISAAVAAVGTFFASVGTFVATISATTIGAFLIDTLSYIATNLLVRAIVGEPEAPPFSLRTTLRGGEETPRSFIFGKTMTAGSLAYANTFGDNNKWFVQVIALSDLPVKGLSQVFVNSEEVTLGAEDDDKGYRITEYDGHMFVKFYDGTQVAADPYMVSQLAGDAYRPYGSDRIGTGVAYAIVYCLISQEKFAGFPQFRFVVDGVPLYDPSKDDTAGGSGTQRWATPATWGGDGDYLPAVQAYNVLRGMTYGGEWFYGLQGLSKFRVPDADWITEIEKCRATIGERSGAVPTYRCSVEVEVSQEIGRALEGLMTSCAGRISETGGVFKPLVGPVGSSVKSFTDDDILATAEQTFIPYPPLANTANGITCSYPEPEEGYSLKTAPPLYDDTLEEQDGGYRLLSRVTLPNVPYREQVQRLMKWALAESRRQRRHTLVMPPDWQIIEPNDAITWTSARNGYSNKIFRVDGAIVLTSGDVAIEIVETEPSDYSWNTATDFTEVDVSPVVTVRPPSQSVIGFGVQPVSIQDGASTTKRVGIKLSWSTTGIEDVDGIRFEIRRQDTQEVVARPETLNFSAGALVSETGLVANVTYEARAIYTAFSGRAVAWTSWVAVTTSLTLTQPGIPTLSEELYATRDGSSVKVLIDVEWLASPQARSYQIEARLALDSDGVATGNSFTTFGRTDQTRFEIRDVSSGTWEVRVKGYNEQGVQSAYSLASLSVSGLSTAPVQLQNLRIQKAGGLAILKWDKSTDLDVIIGGKIEIRHSASTTPSWANSVSMDATDGNASNVAVPLRPGTYMIRPVDLTGVAGPETSITTKGVQAVEFTNVQTFTADPTWSGTKTNCAVDTGNLKITNLASEGLYEFQTAFDNTTVGAFRVRPEIDVSALNLTSTIDDRTDPIDSWPDFDDTQAAAIDVIVEMRVTDDDPSGSPVWSDWAQIDSTEEEFRAADFRARLITSSPDYNVLLSALSVHIDRVL